ncbi:hypothetical protein F3Y22_tig00013285pilonHSYRG00220 [Hibiscus syriacus]|uniref:Uncharacterized protein n=1 Tax=Hibiscus syriacus TaxID=106335 RepID=A0A6A3C626_HIBSY|nr:hypothetical protein F3Y22_tig00013285pilonHSYRG00220 [Hibiscus syriacus]
MPSLRRGLSLVLSGGSIKTDPNSLNDEMKRSRLAREAEKERARRDRLYNLNSPIRTSNDRGFPSPPWTSNRSGTCWTKSLFQRSPNYPFPSLNRKITHLRRLEYDRSFDRITAEERTETRKVQEPKLL